MRSPCITVRWAVNQPRRSELQGQPGARAGLGRAERWGDVLLAGLCATPPVAADLPTKKPPAERGAEGTDPENLGKPRKRALPALRFPTIDSKALESLATKGTGG